MQNAKKAWFDEAAPGSFCDLGGGQHPVLAGNRGSRRGTAVALQDRMAKPYDIKERTFLFACDALRAYPDDQLKGRAERAWLQFISAATSGGAHLEEAEAAASRAHFVTLSRGALRELREANYWIRLIHTTKLPGWSAAPALIGESGELVAIVTTIVKRAAAKLKKGKKPGA